MPNPGTRVPRFGSSHTRKPGFGKNPPGLDALDEASLTFKHTIKRKLTNMLRCFIPVTPFANTYARSFSIGFSDASIFNLSYFIFISLSCLAVAAMFKLSTGYVYRNRVLFKHFEQETPIKRKNQLAIIPDDSAAKIRL
jgi:hypothetical protein